jgi:integrase
MLERRLLTSPGNGPLFPDSIGGWRDPSNTSRDLREARGSDEFVWVTSHVFRKTCATTLDESDLSPRAIADQLGHAKVSMTQDHYLSRRLTSRRAAEALELAVGATVRHK